MVVREAGVEDAPQIAQLHIASWKATYADELSADFLAAQDLAVRTVIWRSHIERGVDVWVAEEDGSLVGFIACGAERAAGSSRDQKWEIYNLHVARPRQGQGIGVVLFDSAVRLGREHGAAGLVLWVARTNISARTFYERRGMKHDGGQHERTVGPGEVLHEVRYSMRLPGTVA
jgi:GNAT superfamily N-acetyltransferase